MNALPSRLCVIALLLGGCASASSAKPQATVTIAAPAASTAVYRTMVEGSGFRGDFVDVMQTAVASASAAAAMPLTPDPRLAQLAEWILRHLEHNDQPPPQPAMDLAAHQVGLIEPVPHLVALGISSSGPLGERLGEELADLLGKQEYTHVGGASVAQGDGALVVVAVSWRWAAIEDVARQQEPGSTVRVVGTLVGEHENAQLAVTLPTGTVWRSSPATGKPFDFDFLLVAPGEHRIELLAVGSRGPTVVANFPVYVGTEPPNALTVVPRGQEPFLDPEAAAERLFDLINSDREQAGLEPLIRDPRLAQVALAHSRDMDSVGFVGHTSPTTGSAGDRVAAAGIETGLVLENIGRGYSISDVHGGLMSSPGHRANIVSPRATHVGLGIEIQREDDQPAYLVTQVFARFAGPIDPHTAVRTGLQAVNRARKGKGVPQLQQDRALSELAVNAARSYFERANLSRKGVLAEVNDKLGRLKVPYRKVGALMTVVVTPEDTADIEMALDPRATHVGLGYAQGERADSGRGAIAVVMILGY